MENIVLVSMGIDVVDLVNPVDGETYNVLFNKPKCEVMFPGPKYVKRGKPFNDIVEYYSEILTNFDKQVIPMKYRGISQMKHKYMFEIDMKSILRDRKLNQLLGD